MRYTRAQIVNGTGFEPGALFEQVEDYNGWTNRETWAVALWINNDQGWQESVLDALRAWATENDYTPTRTGAVEPHAAYDAGEIVKDNVEDLFSFDTWSEGGDYANVRREIWLARDDIGSLYRVNWTEIGASFLSDIAESGE